MSNLSLIEKGTRIDLSSDDLADKFGIAELTVNDGLVWATDGSGNRKWFSPDDAFKLSEQLNDMAKAFALQGREAEDVFRETCQLAYYMATAGLIAKQEREKSVGTGNMTERVTKELTAKEGHALDWDGTSSKVLDGLVAVCAEMFPDLDVGTIGDVMKMTDVGGKRKLGTLKMLDDYKNAGKPLANPKTALDMYDALADGRIVAPPPTIAGARFGGRDFETETAKNFLRQQGKLNNGALK